MKVLTLGINDRGLRFFRMKYVPQSVPQYCEYKKRGEKPFKVLVQAQHLFYLERPLMPVIPPLCWIKKMVPCFIFNMLNRQSLKLVEDLGKKKEGDKPEGVTDTDPGGFWFLGRSVNVHPNQGEVDPKTANVIDYMVHAGFWQGLRRQMDLPKSTMIIIAVAGVGAWEVVRNMIAIFT